MIKPSILFVLILCISGYVFAQQWHKTHYQLKRSNGYHTFLMSAAIGLFLFAIGTIVYAIGIWLGKLTGLHFSVGELVLIGVFRSESTHTEFALFDISIIALILSRLLPKLYYINEERKFSKFMFEFSMDSESPEFTQLFFKSHYHELPILFTMSDRKVYIGYIYEIQTGHFNDIYIVPYLSGYRDRDTLELHKITPYHAVMEDIENEQEDSVELDKFTIALPLREIVHAHLHDFRYEERFREKEEEHKEPETYL
ncbi:hypothetical protein TW84_15140 [Vibrio neptunius]|uniref:hypothetical protein n=1 Tax=Vibrio neptunius TaxID=170651 RepID=UPI0005F9D7EA|nr:hypothetical protein [Vibrio neptunius]KJY88448.1 hypothetical protein TW84_15140 [Vibrio neptunius]